MKANLYDGIITLVDVYIDFSKRIIPKGTQGTIVECYENPEGYAVDLAIPDRKLINTDDLWEVRVQVGNNIFRLLGFFVKNNLLILTNGFTKKTQKTPPQEINLAQQRKRDYLNRRLNNE